jgi:two-component system chemotaxis response regulator CheY
MSDRDLSFRGSVEGEAQAQPPRAAGPLDAVQLTPRPGTAPGVPRVMLIEDDFILRAHLAELMMIEGYVVTCAADGAEALRRLQQEPTPSLILVDMVLPRVDGIAFRKAQLRDPVLKQIPTIALTALKNVGDIRSLAFSAVVRKPLSFDRLLDVIAHICPLA